MRILRVLWCNLSFPSARTRLICSPHHVYLSRHVSVGCCMLQRQEAKKHGARQLIKFAASLKQRKYREKHDRILLEGWRLVNDALLAKLEPISIFIFDKNLLEKCRLNIEKNIIVEVDSGSMKKLTCNVTPPGIVGVFRRPAQGAARKSLSEVTSYKPLRLTVVCDGLKDPSNLGTLIRVCAASGCTSFITTQGSADVWDPKVLRCAAGGRFHLPIFQSLSWEEIVNQFESDSRIYLASSNLSSQPIRAHYEVDWTLSPSVLIIGGETTGLSNKAQVLAHERSAEMIRIPMVDGVDSLSAAISATVIIYEAYRQQIHKTNMAPLS